MHRHDAYEINIIPVPSPISWVVLQINNLNLMPLPLRNLKELHDSKVEKVYDGYTIVMDLRVCQRSLEKT